MGLCHWDPARWLIRVTYSEQPGTPLPVTFTYLAHEGLVNEEWSQLRCLSPSASLLERSWLPSDNFLKGGSFDWAAAQGEVLGSDT